METKRFLSIGAAFMMMAALVWAEDGIPLNDAINSAISDYASGPISVIPQKNKNIAIIAFEINRRDLMEYFFDTMLERLWEKGNETITIYERKEAVSPETAQRIGRFVGVSTVIYGSMAGLLGISRKDNNGGHGEREEANRTFSLKDTGNVTVGGWVSLSDAAGADNGDPTVGIEPYLTVNRNFNNGFSLNIHLYHHSGINTGSTAEYHKNRDTSPVRDHLGPGVTPAFSFSAGPGGMKLSPELMPVFYLTNNYDFLYEYGGRGSGAPFIVNPVILYGIDSWLGYRRFSFGTDDMGIADGADYDKDTREYGYGLWIRDVYFSAGAGIGLFSFRLTPYFFIGTNDYQIDGRFRKIRFGTASGIIESAIFGLKAGVPIGAEVSRTAMKRRGVSLIPYIRASFGAIGIPATFYIYRVPAGITRARVNTQRRIKMKTKRFLSIGAAVIAMAALVLGYAGSPAPPAAQTKAPETKAAQPNGGSAGMDGKYRARKRAFDGWNIY